MRWSDMDVYQHINNVAFLGYFEMARVSLFFEHPTHDEKTGLRRGLDQICLAAQESRDLQNIHHWSGRLRVGDVVNVSEGR